MPKRTAQDIELRTINRILKELDALPKKRQAAVMDYVRHRVEGDDNALVRQLTLGGDDGGD